MHCGPGIDTVIESAYAGNRKLVKIAGDCEKPQARLGVRERFSSAEAAAKPLARIA